MNPIIKEMLEKQTAAAITASADRLDASLKALAINAEQASEVLNKLAPVKGLRLIGNLNDYTFRSSKQSVYLAAEGIKTRPEFAAVVKQISEVLNEEPETDVTHRYGTNYEATWKGSGVKLWLSNPTDCKLIEAQVEEEIKTTVMVTKLIPHPACKAALRELENING